MGLRCATKFAFPKSESLLYVRNLVNYKFLRDWSRSALFAKGHPCISGDQNYVKEKRILLFKKKYIKTLVKRSLSSIHCWYFLKF